MIVVTFNTKLKNLAIYPDLTTTVKLVFYENVPTVQSSPEGYYLVLQDVPHSNGESTVRVPVLRLPIANTIMRIVN
jgi:hypothetical protein